MSAEGPVAENLDKPHMTATEQAIKKPVEQPPQNSQETAEGPVKDPVQTPAKHTEATIDCPPSTSAKIVAKEDVRHQAAGPVDREAGISPAKEQQPEEPTQLPEEPAIQEPTDKPIPSLTGKSMDQQPDKATEEGPERRVEEALEGLVKETLERLVEEALEGLAEETLEGLAEGPVGDPSLTPTEAFDDGYEDKMLAAIHKGKALEFSSGRAAESPADKPAEPSNNDREDMVDEQDPEDLEGVPEQRAPEDLEDDQVPEDTEDDQVSKDSEDDAGQQAVPGSQAGRRKPRPDKRKPKGKGSQRRW